MRIQPALQSGSPLALYQALWTPLYESVLNILGSTGTILPIGDPAHGQPNATTFITVGEEQVTFTWSEAPNSFDTKLDLTDPDSFQGIIPILTFNGTDEEADSPDATYWSRVGGVMSLGLWVNMTAAANSTLLTKYTAAGDGREWQFVLEGAGGLRLHLYDEDDAVVPNGAILSTGDTGVSNGVWVFLAGTYDGTANATGINLYQDGAFIASTDSDNPNFASMRDTGSVVRLGNDQGATFFDGKMAGGPLGLFYTQKVLSADEVKRLYNLGRAALGV